MVFLLISKEDMRIFQVLLFLCKIVHEDLFFNVQDSPVFNYLNSLSPIKPVKSVHFTQTFSSLSFASLPSVFTSPHVSSHRESRFLKR